MAANEKNSVKSNAGTNSVSYTSSRRANTQRTQAAKTVKRRVPKRIPESSPLSHSEIHKGKVDANQKDSFKMAELIDVSPLDIPMFTITILLLAFGIIMMFSASYATAYRELGDSFYYVKRQLIFAGLGVCLMLIVSAVDYHIWKTRFVLTVITLIAVGGMIAVKTVGMVEKGSERRFEIAGISIQPSEILKLVVIIIMAYMLEKNYNKLKDLKHGFLPLLVPIAVSCALLLWQPHMSATIIVAVICVVMMFVGGCNLKHVGSLIVLGAVGLLLAIPVLNALGYDYFGPRIQSFLDPESDITGNTFQTYQSLVTIGSGGIFGLGLGNSRQKYSYLPESHNDFIFSIICEELGFVGAILIILLFLIFVIRGFYIAARSKDKFGMMMGVGISVHIGLQALMNIAVVSNAMPNTGISLPFFSYGGSALMMQLIEVGILLSISRKSVLE